jgi:hypothetical protein
MRLLKAILKSTLALEQSTFNKTMNIVYKTNDKGNY